MRIGRQGEAARATHVRPIVSERSATDEADLVVLAMHATMGPGEPVRAESAEESLEKLGRHPDRAPLCYDSNGHGLVPRSNEHGADNLESSSSSSLSSRSAT